MSRIGIRKKKKQYKRQSASNTTKKKQFHEKLNEGKITIPKMTEESICQGSIG